MKTLLKLEELAQFLACAITMALIDAPWWTFLLLFIGPDVGILGYLINARVGAMTYNALHHKVPAVLVGLLMPYLLLEFGPVDGGLVEYRYEFVIAGLILYGHASMDRIFGYGLKFGDNFHHTHLGWIGKLKSQGQ
jgi:Domain of unknown function (DUF4260)